MIRNESKNRFALSFRATEMDARAGLCAVAEQLHGRGLSGACAEDIQIALAEAVNNVVEHAYCGLAPGRVWVSCRVGEGHLEIRISDRGRPLPDGQIPAGVPAEVTGPREELPEGGFGWFLIHQLTSCIRYDRRNGCNRLLLCFDCPDDPTVQ